MNRKSALITGAASGLGREFCRLLAADGHDLFLADRDGDGLATVKKELESSHPVDVQLCIQDLGTGDAAERLYARTGKRKLDVLINNAGFGLYGFFGDTDWQKESDMIHLHVLTLTALTKLVIRDMLEAGRGRVLNVSSLAAFQPGPLMAVYYASKAYILSFSEALANEVKGTGVSVTVLAPGWFRTNFQKTTALYSNVPESRSKLHTVTVEAVALKAYRDMKAGRALVIPGFRNRLMAQAPRIIPRRQMTAIIRRIQENLRK